MQDARKKTRSERSRKRVLGIFEHFLSTEVRSNFDCLFKDSSQLCLIPAVHRSRSSRGKREKKGVLRSVLVGGRQETARARDDKSSSRRIKVKKALPLHNATRYRTLFPLSSSSSSSFHYKSGARESPTTRHPIAVGSFNNNFFFSIPNVIYLFPKRVDAYALFFTPSEIIFFTDGDSTTSDLFSQIYPGPSRHFYYSPRF